MKSLSKFCFMFLLLNASTNLFSQSKPSYFFMYGGLNAGAYMHRQNPLDYRAWEFNNFVGVKQPLKPNKSFSGINFGTVLDLSLGSLDNMGIPIGLEYGTTSNKCSGSRDSAGITITQTFNERVRSFYVGIGLSSSATNKDGKAAKFQIGYIPYFSLAKFKLDDVTEVNNIKVIKTGTLEGRYFCLKNQLFMRYRVTEKFTLGFFPYYEGHVFDSAAEITYDDPTNFILYHELFKLNNFGASLCAVISF